MSDQSSRPNGDSARSTEPLRRRGFLASTAAVTTLAGSYGTLAYMAGEFLYTQEETRGWQFVCTTDQLAVGAALDYTTPTGAKVTIARQGPGETTEDFLALSSVCPHLGCRVHWEGNNDRFFCPCHNGAFDKVGNPVAGPPAQANQALMRFPIRVENSLVFVQVQLKSLNNGTA